MHKHPFFQIKAAPGTFFFVQVRNLGKIHDGDFAKKYMAWLLGIAIKKPDVYIQKN